MGLIDKSYLNQINASVQKQISNQPCGCDCNCRPKFEDEAAPGPVPGCNCGLRTNYFVGDYSTIGQPYTTNSIFLVVSNGWNCPFEIQFRWVNVSFPNPNVVSVVLGTINGLIPFVGESQWLTVTLNPGQFFYFEFYGALNTFDQRINIQARNITCAENYGVVGSWTLLAI